MPPRPPFLITHRGAGRGTSSYTPVSHTLPQIGGNKQFVVVQGDICSPTPWGGGCLHVSLSFCMSSVGRWERVNEVYECVCVCVHGGVWVWGLLGLGPSGTWWPGCVYFWELSAFRLLGGINAVTLIIKYICDKDTVTACENAWLIHSLPISFSRCPLSHTHTIGKLLIYVSVFFHIFCAPGLVCLFFWGGLFCFILFLSLTGAVVGNTLCILFVLFV